MFSCQQGELAHKIVKRLYGWTNKRNSEHQIAKCYRRLECARLVGNATGFPQIFVGLLRVLINHLIALRTELIAKKNHANRSRNG